MRNIIVARYDDVATYVIECGLAPKGTRVVPFMSSEYIAGCRCIALQPFPLRFAALASSVVEIPLPRALRDRPLTLDQLRQHAGTPREYRVVQTSAPAKPASDGVVADIRDLAAPLPLSTVGGIMQRIHDVRTHAAASAGRPRQCPSTHVSTRGNIVFCELNEGHAGEHRGFRKRWSTQPAKGHHGT